VKVTNGDTVTLTYVNTHNVYQFDDVNAFRNCDFNLAVKICETGGTDSTCDNIPTDTNGILYYFGCSIGGGHHCKNHGMKFAMVVSKKHRAPPLICALEGQDAGGRDSTLYMYMLSIAMLNDRRARKNWHIRYRVAS
jgi:hypothetical protein